MKPRSKTPSTTPVPAHYARRRPAQFDPLNGQVFAPLVTSATDINGAPIWQVHVDATQMPPSMPAVPRSRFYGTPWPSDGERVIEVPMKKVGRAIAVTLLAVVALFAIGWLFVVPPELKVILGPWRWHDSHVHASGYVEREPPGTRIYWEEFGQADGPPVIVLHAGLCTIAVMRGQIEVLAAASYHVIAIDSRGHGKSTNTAPVPTYEMLSDDVVGVMDALKIQRADIVGWSDGGNLGLDLARRHPDRVRKVVAFGANRTPPPDGQDAEMTKEFKEAKAGSAMLWPIRRMYEKRSSTPEKWPEFFEREHAMVFAGPNWSLEQLATIRAPILLINGEHDLVLLRYATEMQKAIAGARLQIIPGGTHEVPLAKPDVVNPIMLSFLRDEQNLR